MLKWIAKHKVLVVGGGAIGAYGLYRYRNGQSLLPSGMGSQGTGQAYSPNVPPNLDYVPGGSTPVVEGSYSNPSQPGGQNGIPKWLLPILYKIFGVTPKKTPKKKDRDHKQRVPKAARGWRNISRNWHKVYNSAGRSHSHIRGDNGGRTKGHGKGRPTPNPGRQRQHASGANWRRSHGTERNTLNINQGRTQRQRPDPAFKHGTREAPKKQFRPSKVKGTTPRKQGKGGKR